MSACAVPEFRVSLAAVPSLSPGKLWNAVRRDLHRGASAMYHDYQTLPRIESWQWPYWGESARTMPVHTIAGAANWRAAAWMLASWFCATDSSWPITIHDDGTLPESAGESLRQAFPGCLRLIPRDEADATAQAALRAFPFCEEYRATDGSALKVFDAALFTEGARFIFFDSDVLFFQKPHEILTWTDVESDECRFCEDMVESTIITAVEARDELGVKLWRRVDSGIALLWKAAIDFDFIDRTLAQTSVRKGAPERVANTLIALCASQHNRGSLLPKSYEVSPARFASSDAVARHYSGTARERFFADGLKRLRDSILAVGAA